MTKHLTKHKVRLNNGNRVYNDHHEDSCEPDTYVT